MRERVRQLGGSFDIRSGAVGTAVRASYPVAAATSQATNAAS